MPLRIRCPHCRYVLIVADEAAGGVSFCEYCKRGFTVPIPPRNAPDRAASETAGSTCPRCRFVLAPGARICSRCKTDMETRRRPPLWRRIRWDAPRTWLVMFGTLFGLVLCFVAASYYFYNFYRPSSHPVAAFEPHVREQRSGKEEAQSLFLARTPAERTDAAARLRRIGHDAAAELAAGLLSNLEDSRSSAIALQNQRTAVRLLGEIGGPSQFEPLERAQRVAALRDDAVCSRAMLGDSRVVREAASVWKTQLQRVLFAVRLVYLQSTESSTGRDAWYRAEWEAFQRYTDALRKLGPAGIEAAAEAYWDSWSWLGQNRGEGFSTALFELAKPRRGDALILSFATQDEAREDVRAARRMIDDIAQRAAPSVHAALILTLGHCTPQYQRLRERHVAALAERLGGCAALEQQRLAWAIAALTGREFLNFSKTAHPSEAQPDVAAAIVNWARTADPSSAPAELIRHPAYETPPKLTRRIVSPQQQHRRALLPRFSASFAEAEAAANEWIEAQLGYSPAIAALLSPSRTATNESELMAALLVAADAGHADALPLLQAWRIAPDQPRWVRQLAGIACAAYAVRGGVAVDWPADGELDPPDIRSDGPGWSVFGEIIACGGPRMVELLERAQTIAFEDRERFIAAARRELTRRDRTRTHDPATPRP